MGVTTPPRKKKPPVDAPRWLDYMPLSDLQRAPRNPKGHAAAIISESMNVHGYVEAITLDERTGRLVAGHGRLDELEARKAAEGDPPEGIVVDKTGAWLVPVQRGWSSKDDAQAENYLLVSNQGTIAGGWVDEELRAMVGELVEAGELKGSGFTDDEVAALLADDEEKERSNGSLLSLADVTVGEPSHQVHHGEHYLLGGRHHLVVAKVIAEWSLWVDLLQSDRLFVPYPGVYVPLSQQASNHDLVMVQPNLYLAGHVLDKWAAVHGADSITKVTA